MDTRPKKICESCGGEFRVWETGRPPKCCGDYCRLRLWRKKQRENQVLAVFDDGPDNARVLESYRTGKLIPIDWGDQRP